MYYLSVPVPTPAITVSGSLFVGDPLTLNCTNNLSSSVDTSVAIEVKWMVNGSAVAGDGRISISGSSLTFSPLTTSDTGSYTCTLTLTSQLAHVTVQAPQQSVEKVITVQSRSSTFFVWFFL